jgi:hypothetical protein
MERVPRRLPICRDQRKDPGGESLGGKDRFAGFMRFIGLRELKDYPA